MLLWGFISTSSVSTSDTLFGAHASPELAEPAGIALALAHGDAVLALVAPPFEGPATRDAEVGLSTWIGCMRNQIQLPIQLHSQSNTSASNSWSIYERYYSSLDEVTHPRPGGAKTWLLLRPGSSWLNWTEVSCFVNVVWGGSKEHWCLVYLYSPECIHQQLTVLKHSEKMRGYANPYWILCQLYQMYQQLCTFWTISNKFYVVHSISLFLPRSHLFYLYIYLYVSL